MSKWAQCGKPLYEFSQRCICITNSTSLSKHIFLPLNHYGFLYSRNIFISTSPRILQTKLSNSCILQNQQKVLIAMSNQCNTSAEKQQPAPDLQTLSSKDKLKRAVKDYGATVIVFHVTISLMSLGLSYLIISSGIDVSSLVEKLGFKFSGVAAGASTFVVAYAFHKMFAPVRISITLGATPFIVRYLRRIKILKPPKVNGP